MIGTVTLNPSIDRRYIVECFQPGRVNRVIECCSTAGGKGLNVARVARLAGEKVMATGFAGGHLGEYIIDRIREEGIEPSFIRTRAENRCCINLFDRSTHIQTELLEPGEEISETEVEALLEQIRFMSGKCDAVVVSGSAPSGTSPELYAKIVQIVVDSGAQALLDTSGAALVQGMRACPMLIKPNIDELEALTGVWPDSVRSAAVQAERLRKEGPSMVAISLGANGAVLASETGVFSASVPKINAVNTVGCGDAMMAGFAVGLLRNLPLPELLRFAAAIAVANALQEQTGFIDSQDVAALLPKISVEQMLMK